MKIISLETENVKRVKCVHITPRGNVVEITGPNASGKTSVLDSIWYAMGGADALPSTPLRRGASNGHVTLDLGDIIVTRVFRQSGTSQLRIEPKGGGEPLKRPQEILDSIRGRLGFDPLAFSRMKPTEQLHELRRLVKLDVDIDALDRQNAVDYDARTDINRDAKALRTRADGIVIPEGTPDQEIDVPTLIAKMEEAGKANAAVETAKADKQRLESIIASVEAESKRLIEESTRLMEQAKVNAGAKRQRGKELIASAKIEAAKESQRLNEQADREIAEAKSRLEKDNKLGAEVISKAKAEAERIVARAIEESDRLRKEATANISVAQSKAESLREHAKDDAENIVARASAEAGRLDSEAENLLTDENLRAAKMIDQSAIISGQNSERRKALAEFVIPESVDTAGLRQEIDAAAITNRRVTAKRNRAGLIAESEQKEKESREITRRMEQREEQKRGAIERANMPVLGLSFGNGEVLFNGLPLSQASSAEQLRISTAVAISLNPKLRVILIQDGSLLDANGMELMAQMAEEKDMQVWIERLAQHGKSAVIMEDGRVVEKAQQNLGLEE